MRVLFAALFVYGSMLGTIGVLDSLFRDQLWPWWTKILPAIVMLASLLTAAFVFNSAGYRPSLRRKSLAEHITELEAQGQLLRQPFHATRAFAVEEFDDEGPHYYIELTDGHVLYLNGQYLHEYGPITDDPEMNQARSFPCTEFEVLRHRDTGFVLCIRCAGTVLEPEITVASRNREDFQFGDPDDGEIITDKPYEALKREQVRFPGAADCGPA